MFVLRINQKTLYHLESLLEYIVSFRVFPRKYKLRGDGLRSLESLKVLRALPENLNIYMKGGKGWSHTIELCERRERRNVLTPFPTFKKPFSLMVLPVPKPYLFLTG